jgi:protein-S-isoprenylcysteine O-methyltransferase Ste14
VLELVDLLLAATWLASVLAAWGRPGRRPLGAFGAGVLIVTLIAVLGVRIERDTGGRLWSDAASVTVGLALVMLGAIVHARARRALGAVWGPVPTPGAELVTHGPYARARHPAYAGLVMMATGTFLAHASLAVGAAATGLVSGLALKARLEDRRLEARFGEQWRRWAGTVPAWSIPGLRRRGTPR